MTLQKTRIDFLRSLTGTVHKDPEGALCLTCLRPVDEELMVGPRPGDRKPYAELLVRCHGAEQLATFDMGTEDWTDQDFKKQRRTQRWFDPHQVASVTENR